MLDCLEKQCIYENKTNLFQPIVICQTDATDVVKRMCLGRDKMIYGHPDKVMTPEEFFEMTFYWSICR